MSTMNLTFLLESEIKLQNPICLKNELLLQAGGFWDVDVDVK